ncbi:MAG: type II toxin-antitoxin system VapC family toxin [Ideonella sp.]|nr:type II toxin-antitoxin system VapC family toxin [Ideonella sp.]
MTTADAGPPAPRVLYVAEPPAVWAQRPPVVADCSVVAALVFAEPSCDEAAGMLSHKAVHAPALLPFEVANVARTKLRAGAQPEQVANAVRDFAEQRIALHPVPPEAMLQLALDYELSAYDAAYLWLAAEMKAPLATFDRKLAQAARGHLGGIE